MHYQSKFLVVIVFFVWVGLAEAQDIIVDERDVKAAFLYNFAKLTEWPTNSFSAADSPIVFGIVGDKLLAEKLEGSVTGRKINGRHILVRRCQPEKIPFGCHLIFVSGKHDDVTPEVLSQVAEQSVLTIGEGSTFIQFGGVIRLITKGERLQFEVNPDAAKRGNLILSSKLLKLAKVAKPSDVKEVDRE